MLSGIAYVWFKCRTGYIMVCNYWIALLNMHLSKIDPGVGVMKEVKIWTHVYP